MFHPIRLQYVENLPMPLIYLPSPDALAAWYLSQLEWAIGQGHRELTISCFDTAPMGYDIREAARAVLQVIRSVLAEHSDITALTILCGDEAARRAYGQLLEENS